MELLVIGGLIAVTIGFFLRGRSNGDAGRNERRVTPLADRPPPHLTGNPGTRRTSARTQSPRLFEFCALDTETTGLVPRSRRHRAFEISCVKFTPSADDGWTKTRFSRYIRVDDREIRGLKASPMWLAHVSTGGQTDAIPAEEALEELRWFVGNLPLVCHNAKFDKCVIENEIDKTAHGWNVSNRWICTLLMARENGAGRFVGYSPGRADGKSYKLEDVAVSLGISVDNTKFHKCHYDAEIAGTIFLDLYHLKAVPLKSAA